MDDWFGLFAAAVWRYLDGLAGESADGRTPSEADFRKLVAAWQAVLRLHDADRRGGCSGCERDHRPEACTVWQVAIGYFVRRLPRKR